MTCLPQPLMRWKVKNANGTLRQWIHYIAVRTNPSTQKEHRVIAEEARELLRKEFPSLDFI